MSQLLSVVVPVCNEEPNLVTLYERLAAVGRTPALADVELELLFVDDGSVDRSYDVLCELVLRDARVRVLKLSRNFGSHGACLAGLQHASGDYAVILAADLQDPPEDLPRLLEPARQGFDVVWAVREHRSDPPLALAVSRIYYRIMRRIALPSYPPEGFDFVLLSRRVLETVFHRAERNTSLFGQVVWAGFRQTSVRYVKARRRAGESKWSVAKKVKLAIDSLVAFSYTPIRAISLLGFLVSLLGFSYALFIVIRRLTRGVPVEGWSSLMVALLILSGIQMIMLGVIGEYLWRTLDEARLRPPYIVAEMKGVRAPSASGSPGGALRS